MGNIQRKQSFIESDIAFSLVDDTKNSDRKYGTVDNLRKAHDVKGKAKTGTESKTEGESRVITSQSTNILPAFDAVASKNVEADGCHKPVLEGSLPVNTSMSADNIVDAACPDTTPVAGGDTMSSNLMMNRTSSFRYKNLLDEEIEVRNSVGSNLGATGKGGFVNVIGSVLVNLLSALFIFLVYLVCLESLLSIGLSVGLTIYTYNLTKQDSSFDGGIMNWVLLSFAVITPLSASISMAFSRRENALIAIAEIKSTMFNLYSAHICWDWSSKSPKPTGRAASSINWLEHGDEVLHSLFRVSILLTRTLTLPIAGRSRHYVLPYGKRQREKISIMMRKLHRSILEEVKLLTDKCEVLKYEGLPGNEAARIRQWERQICQSMEKLIVIKRYRTPQALRSFGRLFTVILAPFYAPYYAQMATDLNSLGMAVAFSVVTSIALTSLFECVSQLEDPFVGSGLDIIDVEAELRDEFLVELLDLRDRNYPNSPPFEANIMIPITKEPGPDIRLFQGS